NDLDTMRAKQVLQGHVVSYIAPHEFKSGMSPRRRQITLFNRRVVKRVEIIQPHGRLLRIQQRPHQMRADKSGGARNQYLWIHSHPYFFTVSVINTNIAETARPSPSATRV